MTMMLTKDAKDDMIERGYSRRQLGEITALLGAGVAASSLLGGSAMAQQQAARGVKGAVRIGSNECWTGPFPLGRRRRRRSRLVRQLVRPRQL